MSPNLENGWETLSPLSLDHQSTTPCDPNVLTAMEPYWSTDWGNASSKYNRPGIKAAAAVNLARERIASTLGVQTEQVIFTSGATEANNLALIGYARARALLNNNPGHLITLVTEHHSVLDPLRQLKKEGFRLTEIHPNSDGLVSTEQLEKAIEKDTFLVSIMLANNEIGVIQPISELSKICKEKGIILHTDAVQAFGHIPLNVNELGVDLLSLSGHKIYGPKGIGALIMTKKLPITPLQWGGNQEQGIRPGTLPVPLIVGLAKATEIAMQDLQSRMQRLSDLRNHLLNGLSTNIPDLIINGSIDQRLPHNLNISIPSKRGNQLHRKLKRYISCSNGSACNNGAPSHVLMALGRTSKEAEASLRLSLGRSTTLEEIDRAIFLISETIKYCK